MLRWLRASLYRKLILSHVGVLLFLFVLGVTAGSIAWRVHILDLMKKRFASQTQIMFEHLKEELDILQRKNSKEHALLPRSTSRKPSSSRALQKTPSPVRPRQRVAPRKPPPQQANLEKLTPPQATLNLLGTTCQRIQESSVVLSALVAIQKPNGMCLMESRPRRFVIYWQHNIKLLPKSCRGLIPAQTSSSGPSSSKAREVVVLPKMQHCRMLQRLKKRWKKRNLVVASYRYALHPPAKHRVTYRSIPSLHRSGSLPILWISFWILLVVGVGLLTIPISRSITQPLRELMRSVRNIQGGDLTQEVFVKGGDEVAQLSVAVNEMRGSLLQHQEQRRAMIADISHEIRTPLARIRVVGESIADGLMREPDRLTQAMEGICKQVDEIDQLMGDILDIAKMEVNGPTQLQLQSVHMGQLLQEIKKTLTPAAQAEQKHLKLGRIDDPLPEVQADFRRIRQVLNNLIQNAIRYSPEGGTIALSAWEQDGWVRCEVEDQGAGVPEEEREKIFERLYRTDSSRSRLTGGQGLGLAIVKQIILAHNGELGVEDATGGGACFWFQLPQKEKG